MAGTAQLGPCRSLLRAAKLGLCGRIHFPRGRVGRSVEDEDGRFTIFREMTLDPEDDEAESPGVVLKVRFRFKRCSARVNRRLSLIPAPFIVAQNGFRSKLWMMDDSTGEFLGFYGWDTEAAARDYMTSFPMRLMRKRAAPDSLRLEVGEQAAGGG